MYRPDRIKPFMLHPVESVRTFATEYFYNRHYQPSDLVDWLFKAIDLHGAENCVHMLVNARTYTWTEDQLLRIVDRLECTGETERSSASDQLMLQYQFVLLQAPPSFLMKHRDRLLDSCPFSKHHRTILETFFQLSEITSRSIFEQLMQCALDPHIVVGFRNFPYDYGRFLGRQLGHLADATEFAEFAAICSDNQQWNRWHALLLHEALRHNRRIDLRGVIGRLSEVGNPASDAILFTVKQIGDSVLAKHILSQAQRYGKTFRQQALEALTSIKHACVAEFCVQRLKKTRDVTERGPLYRCLASLVDEASVRLLERGERRGDYDPGLFDLSHALLIVKIILSGDNAGAEEESRLLADIDRRERKQRDEMLSSLEQFLNSSS